MNNAEEATKVSRDVRFTVLGRALADAIAQGNDPTPITSELAILRRREQDSADKQTQFAGLARQVGDARRSARDLAPLFARLVQLRAKERGGTISG